MEQLNFKNIINVKLKNTQTGEIIKTISQENMVTDTGKAIILNLLGGDASPGFRGAVGTGSGATSAGTFTLSNEIGRKISIYNRAGTIGTFSTNYNAVEAIGNISEVGFYLKNATNQYIYSYPTTYYDYNSILGGYTSKRGQGFLNTVNQILRSVNFYLGKVGNPTFNIWASLYAYSGIPGDGGIPIGSALASSSPISSINITPSMSLINFQFTTEYTLTAGTYYAIVIERSDTWAPLTDCVYVGEDIYSPQTRSSCMFNYSGGSWIAPGYDCIFYLLTSEFGMLFNRILLSSPIAKTTSEILIVDMDMTVS